MVFEDEHHVYLHEVVPDESVNQLQQSSDFYAQPQYQRHESFGHFGQFKRMDTPDASISDSSIDSKHFGLTEFGHFGEDSSLDIQAQLDDGHCLDSMYGFEQFGVDVVLEESDSPLH